MENYLQRLAQIWGPDANNPATARQWIEAAVTNQEEEGLYLDFKQKSDNKEPAPNDDDKANLAKAISGFANTDGGLIIWGVRAKPEHKDAPDVATELRPISNLRRSKTCEKTLLPRNR